MKSAVCILIKHHLKDVYLAVSRRDNQALWGFPGGKVDDMETHIDALQREVSEELGIILFKTEAEPIHCGLVIGEINYWVTTYMLINRNKTLIDDNIMIPEEGLVIGWKTEAEMCDDEISPFAVNNIHVFEAMREIAKLKNCLF